MSSKILALFLVLLAAFTNARTIFPVFSNPPNPDEAALMARYIVNESNYTSIGTVSIRNDTKNYPYVSLLSLSDGTLGKGSGVPYVYTTPMDYPGQDIEKNDNVTLMMSLMQNGWCTEMNYDPMDPRCARITVSGKLKKISKKDEEYGIAKSAVFTRHPWLAHMPENHNFFFAKLEIETICLLAKFGGPQYVTPKEYYNVNEAALLKYTLNYK